MLMHTHTHMHTYAHTYMHMHAHTHICIHSYTHKYILRRTNSVRSDMGTREDGRKISNLLFFNF
jgi:hypothetical protein